MYTFISKAELSLQCVHFLIPTSWPLNRYVPIDYKPKFLSGVKYCQLLVSPSSVLAMYRLVGSQLPLLPTTTKAVDVQCAVVSFITGHSRLQGQKVIGHDGKATQHFNSKNVINR